MTGTTIHIPTLETERLVLRAPQAQDFDAYADFCASQRAVGVGGPYPREVAFDRLLGLVGQWHIRGYGRWMVTLRDTGAVVGVVGLFHPEGWPEAEVSWSVFDGAEGKGIASEAARAARTYAYDVLGWTTVISCMKTDNTRSIALARRLGCVMEGTFDHAVHGPHYIFRHPSPEELAA